jgi:starvation-inducible DNA-binding protein
MATVTPFSTRQPLAADTRKTSVRALNQALADLSDLYSQTKQAHWNVKGPNFIALHKLFDEVAGSIEPLVDTVAERVVTLGGLAMGTVRMAAEASRLKELSKEFDAEEVLRELADRLAQTSKSSYAAVDTTDKAGDRVTSDLFSDIAATLDKALYFIEVHLQTRTSAE